MKINIDQLRKDGVLFKAQKLKDRAGDNVMDLANAKSTICVTLSKISNQFIREDYTKKVAKVFGDKSPKNLVAEVNRILKESEPGRASDDEDTRQMINWPDYFNEDNRNDFLKNGFTMTYKENDRRVTGIHFAVGNFSRIETVSNFVIRPLFHVWSQNVNENKKLFEVKNAYETAVLDFEAAATISVDRFSATINAKHNFMWTGNLLQLKRLMEYLGYNVQRCEEVKILGWQPEGFFAYTDKFLSNQELIELDEYGIGKHNDRLYFSPSRSILNKNARQDDNQYETLKYLNFNQSPISFEKWAKLMHVAYPGNGKYAVGFAFICLFRDLVLKIDGNCPHLYAWGSPGSGKSKMMESLVALFFCETRSFQLNSGTDFALSRFLEVFRNTFHFLNELDDSTIKPIWLQWIKGAYDNEGRERGKGGSKNMTEVMKVNSAIGLAGQKIVSVDDNALPMRCIIRNFKPLSIDSIPQEQLDAYNELKRLESEGGFNSLLSEILKERQFFAKEYHKTFSDIFVEIRKIVKDKNLKWNERIARNYSYLLAMVKLACEKFTLPFNYRQMFDEVVDQVHDMTSMITGTDATSEFWRILNKMADQGKIVKGRHYTIEVSTGHVRLYNKEITLPEPTRLLYLRLGTTHSYYKQDYRSETGKEGINSKSLETYLETKDYFIGTQNKKRFNGAIPGTNQTKALITSCHVFNYDMMEKNGYYLDFDIAQTHSQPQDVPVEDKQEELPF